MARYERTSGPEGAARDTSNTAIVAIAVIILLAVVAFFIFMRPGTVPVEENDGPDIELEIEPPATDPPATEPSPGDGGGGGGGE